MFAKFTRYLKTAVDAKHFVDVKFVDELQSVRCSGRVVRDYDVTRFGSSDYMQRI